MRTILKQKLLWVAAFGYFVDLYDLVLYGAVRVSSLESLGLTGKDGFLAGAALLNWQMAGMLAGGFFFGMVGDRRGRKEALFGSILIYSIATFLNAYAWDYHSYAVIRFVAGFGLAGELGAAVTLVSEVLPQHIRGLGTAFIAAVGFMGAVLSSFLSQKMDWQNAYRLGGMLGFLLLFTRMSVSESRLFLEARAQRSSSGPVAAAQKPLGWGSIGLLFGSAGRIRRLGLALLAGVPIWFVAGILSYFAPEFAREFQVRGEVTAGNTIMMGYLGAILGDIACGVLSQRLRSRKRAVMIFIFFGASLALFHPLFSEGVTASGFYLVRFAIGFGNGYSAMLIAWTAEMFGTNLRTTAANALSNLMRASVIPISIAFQGLSPSMGLVQSSSVIGAVCFTLAILSVLALPDTFEKDLNYFEEYSGKAPES
ncbi:MFS transporter [bacterium]|nr:MFS transporter [bacterium]